MGVIPTEAGLKFNARIEIILNELNRALDEIGYINNSISCSVSVGLSPTLISTIFPMVLKKFSLSNPSLNVYNVEGQVSELLPSLRSGKLDFIIGTAIPAEYLSGVVQEPLFKTEFKVCARKGHRLSRCTSLSQLQEADWFLPIMSLGQKNLLELLLFNSLDKMVMRGSKTAALQMVTTADYLTVATKPMVRSHFLSPSISVIPIEERLPDVEFCLFYSADRPLTQAAKNLMDIFCSESKCYSWK
ncbi:LysR substrate-binding domain-containing protein (plasmid) [Serratia sp. L9]|uniref:LysR substrate-binding domain-containing protein n=1 Tax=Serratia sp. L9 TaxID=3423946 RepID=UPI003D676EAE